MSVRVELDELAAAIGRYGFAYLVTVGDDGRPHAVAITPVLSDGALVVGDLGRRTRANAAERPLVSLVWPPVAEGDYSLIVDGDAALVGAASGDEELAIVPTTAVLHRAAPAGAAPSPSGCESDCQPIDLGASTESG